VNRTLPPGGRGHRGPDPCWASRSGRAVPGLGRLVRGTEVDRGGTETAHAFEVIKHGGFERFWLETLCALVFDQCS